MFIDVRIPKGFSDIFPYTYESNVAGTSETPGNQGSTE